eukprot:759913-Hanusia_phi.AAC.2
MANTRALETKRLHFLALHPVLGYQPIDLQIPVAYSPEEEAACFHRSSSAVEDSRVPSYDANMLRAAAWVICMNVASAAVVGAMGVAMSMCQ